ncbi:hypothetical protein [Burkholderia sp. Bp9099]|uniref:hypothetical protein n=1 Tax=Burkholderia sp. Bp9099 TaxID=2184568 RepID=UPI000F602871|nr:hypothetical protein [Burkholderia sp. Bp9099]
MSGVLVIGLPKSLEKRFAVECGRKGFARQVVLADVGKKGRLVLIPYPGQALATVREYADALPNYADAHVIVLPYTELPDGLADELDTLQDCGATIVRGANGRDGWPQLTEKQRPDTAALNSIYAQLWSVMPVWGGEEESEDDTLPSDYFRQVEDGNARVLIIDRVYESCDLVLPIRRKFLKRAIDALAEFAVDGASGRLDAFFGERRLHHAQTGGISSSLTVYLGEAVVYDETSNAHLKQGDATTPQGAARLYYHHFVVGEVTYVVVTYAGPHPDTNVKCTCSIQQLTEDS